MLVGSQSGTPGGTRAQPKSGARRGGSSENLGSALGPSGLAPLNCPSGSKIDYNYIQWGHPMGNQLARVSDATITYFINVLHRAARCAASLPRVIANIKSKC